MRTYFGFVVTVTGHRHSVSNLEHSAGANRPLPINLYFPSAGGILCETIFAYTIDGTRLIDFDLDRFIPMMMSRMIISLKKAAQSGPPHTSIVLPTLSPTALSDTRSHHTADPIRLSVFKR